MDATAFKQVMRRYATGVMVLTVRDGDGFHAVTVNSVTSVSLEPALVLVCLEKRARSHELLEQGGVFALNILSDAQAEIGKTFAFDRAARATPLEHVRAGESGSGALEIEGSLAFMECRVVAAYPGGDHTIFLGEVTNAAVSGTDAGPIIYFESRWLKMQA